MKICSLCHNKYGDEATFCPRDGQRLLEETLPSATLQGTILSGRYRIVERLGEGGMGSVYLAEQISLGGRLVAVKVLHKQISRAPEIVHRFEAEALMVGRLSHPNIVTIHEMDRTGSGELYIVMEYVRGYSLRQLLEQQERLPTARALHIAQQVASALDEAHQQGIIHRDVKPDNIMVVGAEQGQDLVKVLDFGIAKLREAGPSQTQTGMVLGTPRYMSYEQASGLSSAQLDARSDIYSLGVVMYEMLAGGTPFDADTPMGTILKHVQDEAMPISQFRTGLGIPSEVDTLVLSCLAKDRENRPASARELVTRIAQLEVTLLVQPAMRENLSSVADEKTMLPEEPRIAESRSTPPSIKPVFGEQSLSRPQGAAPAEAKRKKRRGAWAVVAAAILILALGYYSLSTLEKETRVPDHPAPAAKKVDSATSSTAPPITAATPAAAKILESAAGPDAGAKNARVRPETEPSPSKILPPAATVTGAASAPSTKSDKHPETPIPSPPKTTQRVLEDSEPAPPSTLPRQELQLQAELALWDAIKNEQDAGLLEGYLKRYPDGQFSEIARTKLDRLRRPVPAREAGSLMDLSSWEILDGSWWAEGGALYGNNGHLLLKRESYQDFVFEFTLDHIAGPRNMAVAGVVRARVIEGGMKRFRSGTSDIEGIGCNFTQGGSFAPFRGQGGKWYFVHPDWKEWQTRETLKRLRLRYRIEGQGSGFRIFADGQLMDSFTDAHFSSGTFVLFVADPTHIVRFSDIRLYRPGQDEIPPPSPAAPRAVG